MNARTCLFAVAFSLLCVVTSSHADVPFQTYGEINLRKVFVPTHGYDSNDPIQLVVEGVLPSPCYTLDKTIVEPTAEGLRVRQFAWVSMLQPCGGNPLMTDPVPFTSVVEVGRLRTGNHSVLFDSGKPPLSRRTFQVTNAQSDEVDNFQYAIIRAVDVNEKTFEGDDVVGTVNGILSSPCLTLALPMEVEIQDDVVVVLPKVVRTSPHCKKQPLPFSHQIHLGPLKMGTYLIHSRSRGGKAIYRSFEVWPQIAK